MKISFWSNGLSVSTWFGLALVASPAIAKDHVTKLVPRIKPIELTPAPATLRRNSSAPSAEKNDTKAAKTSNGAWAAFQELRKKYRTGQIGDEEMWAAVSKIADDNSTFTPLQRSSVLQAQANLLSRAKQPILSSIYAAQALMDATNPLDEEYRRSWQILRDVSRKQPIQNILELVAANTKLGKNPAPIFGSDWNYFLANSLLKQKNTAEALPLYQSVEPGARYYLTAKYQEAMINLDRGLRPDALKALRAIAQSPQSSNKKMTTDEYEAIQDHANMALGRVLYEDKKFTDSIRHYRMVRRDGNQFYDALFEQSWALFMAGYPNHALGTIYAVRSPFFKETFNPEATMLASIIYYWMCRYDDSRQELAEFMNKHQSAIESLNNYLARGITDPNTYYRLFEDTVTGVSSASLGIPRELLVMAVQQDNLLFVRDQYASVVREIQRLDANGIFGNQERTEKPKKYLEKWAAVLKEDIGTRLYSELKALKADYDRLYEQGQFLYVELLMSKKDQLLGKELHSEGKLATLSTNENIRGWGKKTQSWATDNKQEYWSDELGFHIVRVQPLCVVKN